MLNTVADEHKLNKNNNGVFIMGGPTTNASQYDEIGKLFSFMAKTVKANTRPEDVEKTLNLLSNQVKGMKADNFKGGEIEKK